MSRYYFRPNGGLAFMLASALVGMGIALWYYLATETGVDGTWGALLVVISCLLLALDALILFFMPAGGLRVTLVVLGFLGAAGTLAAAWFLHAWWLMAAMVVLAIALVAAMMVRSRADRLARRPA